MDVFTATAAWKTTYPGATAGILMMQGVSNSRESPALKERKVVLEKELRARYGHLNRGEMKALPPIDAYTAYYKRFKKTYHVLLQLESVAQKGKPIPQVAALVEAMFMAELSNQLLTAGHDLEKVRSPVTMDIASGGESYISLAGQRRALKPNDMLMRDADGVICSVIYGSDQRTQIHPDTNQVLFVVYAPPGVAEDAVVRHLGEIRDYALLVSPGAQVSHLKTHVA